MKKSVVFIVLLLVAQVIAIDVQAPSSPFAGLGSAGNAVFSLPPPFAPFDATAVATSAGLSQGFSLLPPGAPFSATQVGSDVISPPSSNAPSAPPTSGSSSAQAESQSSGSSEGSSGGGGGGGGGGGYVLIELSATPVIKSVPLGRPVQFSVNKRPFPLTLLLRKLDVSKQTASWVFDGKIVDVVRLSPLVLDLNRDKTVDAVVEVISFDRSAVTVKASLPSGVVAKEVGPISAPVVPSVQRKVPLDVVAPVLDTAPVVEPVFNLPPELVEEVAPFIVETAWPVKEVAIGVGLVLLILLMLLVIRRLRHHIPHTISEYVEEGLRTGHSKDEICKRLAGAGWSNGEIDSAMGAASKKNI